jgi:GTP cyclohydrolase I
MITKQEAEMHLRTLAEYIGENPNRPGLLGTPDRIIRMWGEIFRGYDPAKHPKITTFDNGLDGIAYDNMILDSGNYYSMCEHHAMPFFGKYVFAYIPNPKGKILGLSKIGRVVDYHAARLQIQERLVADIVADLSAALGKEYPPIGMALLMEGEHLCKTMRGARKPGKMSTCQVTGVFRDDINARNEFLQVARQLIRENI